VLILVSLVYLPPARRRCTLQYHRYGASTSHCVPKLSLALIVPTHGLLGYITV